MGPIEALLGVAIGVPLYDYLSVTGSAAKFTDFDYQYWPPSRLRWLGITALAGGGFITLALVNPPEPDSRLWVIAPGSFGIIFHGCVTVVDIFRQRRVARKDANDS